MSLLGTINPNINPARALRRDSIPLEPSNEEAARGRQAAEEGEDDSLDTGDDTAYEKHQDEDRVGNEEIVEEEVGKLARRLTRQSTRFSTKGDLTNPFTDFDHEATLDPSSLSFSPHNWMKTLLAIQSRDPERYPRRSAGVAFKNLNVHGYGSPTDYQKDVGNAPLEIGALVRYLTGTGKQKINILRDFDGLVKSGEMLVVLGRPGRYDESVGVN
jgi:ATP-binding cassette subfamily G (WHITE) protein 2 (PDR)